MSRSTVEALQRNRDKLMHRNQKRTENFTLVIPGVKTVSGMLRMEAYERFYEAQGEYSENAVYLYENGRLVAFEEPQFIQERLTEGERKFRPLQFFDYDLLVYTQLKESDGFNLYEFYADVVAECVRKGFPVVSLPETVKILEKHNFKLVGDMPSEFSVFLKEEDYKVVSEDGEETISGFNDEDARKKAKEKMGDKKFSMFNKNNDEVYVHEGVESVITEAVDGDILEVKDAEGYLWFVRKIDSSHIYMAPTREQAETGNNGFMVMHVDQLKDIPYYEEVREWLKAQSESSKRTTEEIEKSITEGRYNYSVDLSVEDWDIKIDPEANYGYFEYVGGTNEGPEIQGGLWFDGKALRDYDGVSILPQLVVQVLKDAGYTGEDIYEFNPEKYDSELDEAMGCAIRTRQGGGRNSNVWSGEKRDETSQFDPLTKVGSKDGFDFYRGETSDGEVVWRVVPEGSEAPTVGYRQLNKAEQEISRNFQKDVQFEESMLREFAGDDRPLSDLGLETFEEGDLWGIRDIETGDIVVPAGYEWVDNVYNSRTMMVSVRHEDDEGLMGAVELYFDDEDTGE